MSLIFLSERLHLLTLLKEYLLAKDEPLLEIFQRAQVENSWFTQENIHRAIDNIVQYFLNIEALNAWVAHYNIPEQNPTIKNIGIIMAGNIPLVGFHDVLCTFVLGHKSEMKLSSKDKAIWHHIVQWLNTQNDEAKNYFEIKDQIPKCDAYIATGSNNTSRYFESFFEKYPHIIRKNRSSVAVMRADDNVDLLVEDASSYFGLGCRNVSLVYVPIGYDLKKILNAFEGVEALRQHHSYHNNFDYHLAIYLLNRVQIEYNESIILVDNKELHAPLSVLNYQYYEEKDIDKILKDLVEREDVQCVSTNYDGVAHDKIVPLGDTQKSHLTQYADGVDVMDFLMKL